MSPSLTRFEKLCTEAERLSRERQHSFGVCPGYTPLDYRHMFLSPSHLAPGGTYGISDVYRFHFLAVPCSIEEAIGRMVACVSPTNPDEIAHHPTGACPFRVYVALPERK